MRSAAVSIVSSVLTTLLAVTTLSAFADDGPRPDQSAVSAANLGAVFTYQGKLEAGGAPAEGSHTMRFTLHSDSTVASPVVAPIEEVVDVTGGLFAAELDFGPAVFDGQARWLQVEVHNGSGFDSLSPRQPLTAVPYALFALNGGTLYTAGAGLALTGTQFSVQFLSAGPINGTSDTAARSDHTHFGQAWSGSTTSPGLSVKNNGVGVGVMGEAPGWIGILGKSDAWTGVRGESTQGDGVVGESVNDRGVVGRSTNDYGIIGVTSHEHSAGVLGVAEDNGMGVIGVAQPDTSLPAGERRGIGVVGRSYLSGGNPLYGDAAATGSGVYGESTLSGQAGVAGISAFGPGLSAYSADLRAPHEGGTGAGYFRGAAYGVLAQGGVTQEGAPNGKFAHGVFAKGGNGGFGIYAEANSNGSGLAGFFHGDLHYSGSLQQTSDALLKRDVAALPYGLAEIEALRPVSYTLTEDSTHSPRVGLIAQEVEAVLPSIVKSNPQDGMLSVAYVDIIPVLINAIQEQQAQIEALSGGGSSAETTTGAAPEQVAPLAEVGRESRGPSNAALYSVAGAATLFALALFAVAGALFRTRRA